MLNRVPNFFMELVEAMQQSVARARVSAINLGGAAGPAGGTGSPPGGFIGLLRQGKIAYDTSELALNSGGSSLVDNLNHIRFRLGTLEADSAALYERTWWGL